MSISWQTPAGYLGLLVERQTVEIPIQATTTTGSLSFSIIAGQLPTGLRLDGNKITGAPVEVRVYTSNQFVIRADNGSEILDRTFTLDIDGSDIPKWLTEEGFLNVGEGDNYFVLDNSAVDFQLEASDTDETAGDQLEYYLVGAGQLPPGLSLSSTGRITGFTDPIFSVVASNDVSGAYDTAAFDTFPLDKPLAQGNGFDSFTYDNQTYDYFEDTIQPKRISKFYTFLVAVSDGINEVRRPFRIWVVTEEFLQSDNNIIQVDTNLFRADNSANRVPYWITGSELGRYRANNYIHLSLDVYDPISLPGSIIYRLLDTNNDGTPSIPPTGLTFDSSTGDLSGYVPYQNQVTESYKFTVRAINFPLLLGNRQYNFRGNWEFRTTYAEYDIVDYDGLPYIAIRDSEGKIPETSPEFWELGVSTSDKTFNIDVIGELQSAIEYITESDLGTIIPNIPCQKSIVANNLLRQSNVILSLLSGSLPPGIELSSTGNLTGKVKQFADSNGPGLTRYFDDDSGEQTFGTTFDSGNTTFDRKFTFTVRAVDSARSVEVDKEYFITVNDINDKSYANLYLLALQDKAKRLSWFSFTSDNNIFKPEEIYRSGDTNFGVNNELKVLLFAGIESKSAVEFVQALSRNHYIKRLQFGDVKSAIAKDPATQEILYEVVYVEIVDNLEKQGKSISDTVNLSNKIESKILVSYDAINISSDIPLVSDADHQRVFPNSIQNMRSRIRQVGDRFRDQLPLWMRTIQPNKNFEPGFVQCLEIAYTLPGKSLNVMNRIKASGFDFKLIDFQSDRYLIDALDGTFENKYIAFPQRGEKLP